MYDPQLLKGLDFASLSGVFSPSITNEDTGEPWLLVRPLQVEDYDRGYVQLLSQLTSVGKVTRNDFERKSTKKFKFNSKIHFYTSNIFLSPKYTQYF